MRKFLEQSVFLYVSIYAFVIFISNDAFLPAISVIADDFMVGQGKVMTGVSIFILGALFLQLFIGPLSDKYGRKKILLLFGFMFACFNYLISLSSNLHEFLLLRLFSGAMMPAVGAAGVVAISEYYAKKDVIKYLSLASNVMLLAPTCGPLLGAYILEYKQGWNYIFEYTTFAMIFILVMILFFFPETNQDVINKKQNKEGHQEITLRSKFIGMFNLFKDPCFSLYMLAFTLPMFDIMLWLTGAPVMLQTNLHTGKIEYGWWQAFVFFGLMIGNFVVILLYRYYTILKLVNSLFFIYGFISIFFLIFPILIPNHSLGVVIPTFLFFLIRGVHNSPFNQFILSMTVSHKGSASGLLGLATAFFAMSGAYIASKLAEYSNITFMIAAFISLVLSFIIGIFAVKVYKKRNPDELYDVTKNREI